MAEENQAAKSECNETEHKNHLCQLQHQGYHESHKEEYQALVEDPEYRCGRCSRTAKRSDTVCAPESL
jgi:hypothetical protein